jgi:hypothetical protein
MTEARPKKVAAAMRKRWALAKAAGMAPIERIRSLKRRKSPNATSNLGELGDCSQELRDCLGQCVLAGNGERAGRCQDGVVA